MSRPVRGRSPSAAPSEKAGFFRRALVAPGLMVLLTALFGGLFSGMGAWTGSLVRQAFLSSDKLASRA